MYSSLLCPSSSPLSLTRVRTEKTSAVTVLPALALAVLRFAVLLLLCARRHHPARVLFARKQRSNVNRKKSTLPRFVRSSHLLEPPDSAKARTPRKGSFFSLQDNCRHLTVFYQLALSLKLLPIAKTPLLSKKWIPDTGVRRAGVYYIS